MKLKKKPEKPKDADVQALVNDLIRKGEFHLTDHAIKQAQKRKVPITQILDVLIEGGRNKGKEEYCQIYNNWRFIKEMKVQDRKLPIRVVFTLDPEMNIITVMEVGGRDE